VAKTWLSIRVELLGGRGEELWPPPGRVLAVGPRHTFADLSAAIDAAFARWDLAHLSQFTLPDGRLVTDAESVEEFGADDFGPVSAPAVELEVTKVVAEVGPGDAFRYVFDLGDRWTHCCTVEDLLDPREAFGAAPPQPTVTWGWGRLPDQYGRVTKDDDGSGTVAGRPRAPHPMFGDEWPASGAAAQPVGLTELRGAIARWDVRGIRIALEGHHVDDVLQLAGLGAQVALAADRSDASEALAASFVGRLRTRGTEGDAELADDLQGELSRVLPEGRPVPVDLAEVAELTEGDRLSGAGGYLDLTTGEVVPSFMTDGAEVGDDAVLDVDEDPDRWLYLECEGSRAGWRDMEEFAGAVADRQQGDRLLRALECKGAFRRFRDLVHEQGLADAWYAFEDEGQRGRSRALLVAHGIRPMPPGWPESGERGLDVSGQ